MKTIIIGAGLTGLLYKQKYKNATVLEKKNQVGGLCSTIIQYPYMFDHSGHFIHSNEKFFSKRVRLKKIKRKSAVWFNNTYIPYPFQTNIFKLPSNIRAECIHDFYLRPKTNPKNFEEWLLVTYGKSITNLFMKPYNKKLYKTPCNKLSLEATKFIPKTREKDIIEGFSRSKTNLGYNHFIYYPECGGIGSICNELVTSRVILNEKVIGIKKNKVITNKGEYIYERLISTMPLPELCKILHIKHKLNYVNLKLFFLGTKERTKQRYQWIYYPQKEIPFHRVCIFSNIPQMKLKKNRSSLCAEVSYKKKCDIDNNQIINWLSELGVISTKRKPNLVFSKDIKYAYVVFDKHYKKEIKRIHKKLEKRNIYSVGRFGAWKYSTMGEAVDDVFGR